MERALTVRTRLFQRPAFGSSARRAAALAAFACLVVLLLPLGTSAGEWVFDPFIGVGVGYDGDVDHGVGTGERADWFALTEVSLPVTNSWRTGSLSMAYQTAYEAFRDHSDLDHLDHLARLSLERDWTRSRLRLGHVISYRERQARLRVDDVEDAAPVLVPRERITRNNFRAGFDVQFSRAAGFVARGSWSSVRYAGSDDDDAGLGDSDRYAGTVGLQWRHGKSLTTEYLLGGGKVDERLEERAFGSVGWGLRAELTPLLELDVDLGVSRVESDPTADVDGDGTIDDRPDETTGTGSVRLVWSSREGSTVGAGYGRSVGTTSGLGVRSLSLTLEGERNMQDGGSRDGSYSVYRAGVRWRPRRRAGGVDS
jgi:hypothetical protein